MRAQFDGFSLDYLEEASVTFLGYHTAIGRPLLHIERKANRWLLVAWESPRIMRECSALPDAKLGYYTRLIGLVRDAIVPDPARQLKLNRNHDGAHAHSARGAPGKPGEPALILTPFEGVRIRGLTPREIVERLEMLTRCCAGIAVLAQDLGGMTPAARKRGRRLRRNARAVAVAGDALVSDFYAQAQTRDQRQEDPDVDKMAAELAEMQALRETPTGGGGMGGCQATRL